MQFLLFYEVPGAQLEHWEALWRWEQMKTELKAIGTIEAMDYAVLKQWLNKYSLRVEGSRETYQCLVPERDGRSGERCGKVVSRRDRMQTHVLADHVGVALFQCHGQCGKDGW
jgi:hypothetical protein